MRKCIIIPDSFKGTISSIDICKSAKQSILKFFPDCEILTIPVADGGEGTVECFFEAAGGEKVETKTKGPYFEDITAEYVQIGEIAVIEMSSSAGLPLVGENKDPCKTTTYGVGMQIRHAIENGAKKIIIGLGGSATNDAGCGTACALGTVFTDKNGKVFIPTGGTLAEIFEIDNTKTSELLRGISITAMCDIDNPLYGKNGAAYIFAPQKGADEKMIKALETGLVNFEKAVEKNLDIHAVGNLSGAGAAGGMGAGMHAFLGAQLKSGIDTILDMVGFEEKIQGADYIFTGEGKIDGQSLGGKVVIGVSQRAKKYNIPVIAVVGDVDDDAYKAYEKGVTAIFSINRLAIPFSEARIRSKSDFKNTFEDILRLIKTKYIHEN